MSELPSPKQLAAELISAAERCAPVEPFSARYSPFNASHAVAVRQAWLVMQVADGRRLAGRKIGAVQRRWYGHAQSLEFGWGYILDSNLLLEGTSLPASYLIQPRVEAEFAFLLAKDLSGPGVTAAHALDAAAGVCAAFEVVDSRFQPRAPAPEDATADNGSHPNAVIGARRIPGGDLDLASLGVTLSINGEAKGAATGADVGGNPIHALAALANQQPLRAGEVILTGSIAGAFPIKPGDQVRAEFDRLGTVTLAVE
jgi:2-keto-4-pentenoate hydratase